MPNIFFRQDNQVWRVAKDDSDAASVEANSGDTLVKKTLSQEDYDAIVGNTKTFAENSTADNITLVDLVSPTQSKSLFIEDCQREFRVIDNFVSSGRTSTMKERMTTYKTLLNVAIETAQQTADDTTFSGYPPQYVASLNPGAEVFHILQIPN
tara:strand:+ start:1205 stop:1663 length:459 start_codon:yes stop_codon:yes gene_type:complete